MTSPNGLVCFTNCLLPQEDGSLVERDLWIDERRGLILDAQKTFFYRKERPARIVDLGGNILSPGFLDIQINGAYNFDFSVYEDDESYRNGMKMVAERIVETGVTSLLPTIITQHKSQYPKLLSLLKPFSTPTSATLLGWHAEGPFIDITKRGAHTPGYLIVADEGYNSFEAVYGYDNLADAEDWSMGADTTPGVRMITAAPEVPGVMNALSEVTKRGIVFSIGHSMATTEIATSAVQHGARLITHLFNAMPQLHHRDPSIIGLLGASPHLSSPIMNLITDASYTVSEPLPDLQLPASAISPVKEKPTRPFKGHKRTESRPTLHLDKGKVADMTFERPYYGIIVDGIHCHPNSVRLAYSSHPDGCVLITDAMHVLDPYLQDGVHEWRDGKRFLKQGDSLYVEGTDTLAGSVVTLDKCVRNFSRFTGCSLGEAIKCATYNPAKSLDIENQKGTLRPGAHADLVVLDRQGVVLSTWVKGKQVWTKKD
ncbi:hypothetical protein D9619_001679 [Psilocybe cf. subviscida]|uniref:Amidohydrolase-related domain-containing protein n=1 Tax=Psilocybe cf. subviscida TaxID=2480587 RepID=A0A8H5BDK3_9AGAR|nr:hypothetical protein D9619_001679 [Psilocybe cf. subviscida]